MNVVYVDNPEPYWWKGMKNEHWLRSTNGFERRKRQSKNKKKNNVELKMPASTESLFYGFRRNENQNW